jgi:hypothetical protein
VARLLNIFNYNNKCRGWIKNARKKGKILWQILADFVAVFVADMKKLLNFRRL